MALNAQSIVNAVLHGNMMVASRLMRDLDDRVDAAQALFSEIYSHTGNAQIIGITGNPGAGKSTLVDVLITAYRKQQLTVAVVAIDPSSPYSGGAILGDRIRMQRHTSDDGVYIRSLATRGAFGGLSRSTFDVVSVFDAMGVDRILIETVGVGQDETDIMKLAHTTVVMTVPGLGDDVQAIKSGILEIANVLVVNKSDRDGADTTAHELFQMLDLRSDNKDVDIIQTIANASDINKSAVFELISSIDKHQASIAQGQARDALLHKQATIYLKELVRSLLADKITDITMEHGGFESLATSVAKRESDPYTVAHAILKDIQQ